MTYLAGYLARRVRLGMKFGLETMRALVAEMGHPERAYPSLLVAGTNGKGSVAAYCDAALRASGLRTGRYTSPHLVRVNERITVDGREVTDRDLEIAVATVRAAAERLVRRGILEAHPTFFEVLTAAAFAHFRSRKVDVAVLEVGLGGRLDATNVAEPLASAIVSIDYDHEVYLGRTLDAIAREKAGVMREGRATVVGRLPVEARRALAERAHRLEAELHAEADSTGEVAGQVGQAS
ncbi:MAG TPA: bifunctional folylpolyglutamate synthase/dihydrofolate synthase, partial [Vicinamibacteria bacterium]